MTIIVATFFHPHFKMKTNHILVALAVLGLMLLATYTSHSKMTAYNSQKVTDSAVRLEPHINSKRNMHDAAKRQPRAPLLPPTTAAKVEKVTTPETTKEPDSWKSLPIDWQGIISGCLFVFIFCLFPLK